MRRMTALPAQPSVLATRRGKLTLVVLCAVAFLDFVDASIVNIALPEIRADLHMSVQSLQWIPSGYLLTYGGLMLLGGRAADLLGRRRVLVAGTVLFAAASFAGGLADSSGVLIGARLAQGAGAAMMLPAALSILTTTFREGGDRVRALGAWGGMAGLGSAAGVLLGGLLTQSSSWRWVFFIKPPLFGGALGLAVFSAIATARTNHLLAAHAAVPDALDAGFHRALLAGSIFLLAAAIIALRTTNTRGGPSPAAPQPLPESARR
jgi:MFS family permease